MVESDCSPYAAYAISRQLFSSAEIASLLTRGQKSEARGHSPEDRDQRSEISGESNESGKFEIRNPKSEIGVPPHGDVINAVSRYELSGYMANTLLRDTDQMSMAHALEVRVPFVDPVVVTYVLGFPGEWKMNGRRPKAAVPGCSRRSFAGRNLAATENGFHTCPFKSGCDRLCSPNWIRLCQAKMRRRVSV